MNETNEHNPDGLTPEQYGAPEWRLLRDNEDTIEGDEYAIGSNPKWRRSFAHCAVAPSLETYRRRVSPTPAVNPIIQALDEQRAEDQSARIAELERRVEELSEAKNKRISELEFQVAQKSDALVDLRLNEEIRTYERDEWGERALAAESELSQLRAQLAEREEDRARFLGVQRFWHLIHHSGPDMSGKHWVAKLEYYERATERVRFLTLGEAVDALAAVEAESLAAIRAARAQPEDRK